MGAISLVSSWFLVCAAVFRHRLGWEVIHMNDDEELLHFIHKNAAMGVGTLPQALSLPQSRAMSAALQDQLREYRAIAARSQSYAKQKGMRLKGPGSAALAMSGVMLRAQSLMDPSTSKLAERMIQGSTMGTVEMTRRLHQLSDRADPGLVSLGRQLLQTEEQNIQQMKRFL